MPLEDLSWKLSPEEILTRTDKLIEDTKSIIKKIEEVPIDKVSYCNIIKPLTVLGSQFSTER